MLNFCLFFRDKCFNTTGNNFFTKIDFTHKGTKEKL
jgi:hypothetical protein